MLGGPTQTNKTLFGSLQLAADIRSDRDEVSPRVMSYRPPIAGSDRHRSWRASRFTRDAAAATSSTAVFGGALPTGTDPAQHPGAEAVGARLHARRLARMQTLIPASEKDRLAAHAVRRSSSWRRACGRRTADRWPNTGSLHRSRRCRRRTPNTSSGQMTLVRPCSRPAVGRRLLRPQHAQQPPAPGPRPQPAPPDQDRVRLRPAFASRRSCGPRGRTGSCSRGPSRARRSEATHSRRRTTRRATAIPRRTPRRATG